MKKVLVLEDEASIRSFIVINLRRAGYDVIEAESGEEALERLRRANIPQVTFTGGEPTLRADLVELVETAQWFVTRLNTNGRLLTPELCRRLYEASLDSVQDAVQRRRRRPQYAGGRTGLR